MNQAAICTFLESEYKISLYLILKRSDGKRVVCDTKMPIYGRLRSEVLNKSSYPMLSRSNAKCVVWNT